MTLIHATWLAPVQTGKKLRNPALFIWADTWRAANPIRPNLSPANNPFSLQTNDLCDWLKEKEMLPDRSIKTQACLTLPSKTIKSKATKSLANWTGLPLQAGEPIPEECEWWPWSVEGIALEPKEISQWLTKLPLSGVNPDLGKEILWWCHLERWTLSLITRERWLPQIEMIKEREDAHRARWAPLLNSEDDRNRLEEFSATLPLIATCSLPWRQDLNKSTPLSSIRIINNQSKVVNIVEELLDAELRKHFEPSTKGLDRLLLEWQSALGSVDGLIHLNNDEIERLGIASKHWKEGITGNLASARTCLELFAPNEQEDLWEIKFYLQAQADPSLKVTAASVWAAGETVIKLGEIKIKEPSEILLEGLGRSITLFPPIGKGLETATPESMKITSAEAFILIRTAAKKLRDVGIGVELPKTLSGGVASRLGLSIKAELAESSKGATLGETLQWEWTLMIGGENLTLQELDRLSKKHSPLVRLHDMWIELRPNDLKNAEKFFNQKKELSLDDAIRLTGSTGNTLNKLPVHYFEAGPRLQNVLEKYHQSKAPDPLPAPEGFQGQLRPYQERGLGWITFLHRFHQGACLADDMGLGKTIQLLAFIQSLKIQNELKKTILLIAPTSILTNWQREANSFTPDLKVVEHYGPNRCSSLRTLKKLLNDVDILLTTYGLLQRDLELLKEVDWQGIIIDEAQAIKNSNAKQSKATREIASLSQNNCFRIALTGTPVENRVSDLWALMNFLNPKILGEEQFFHQRYRLPIERYGDISSLRDLKTLVSPFILRRLKTDKSIISDLPEKIEINEWVGLSKEQELLYKQTVDKTLGEIASSPLGQRQGKILGLLTRLKQICNHPSLMLKDKNIDSTFIERSVKLQRLEEILEEVTLSGDRALLFTQFAEWGHLLKEYFQTKNNYRIPFLHGGTPKAERQAMIDQFQEDPRGPSIFLLSLKAGGIGLNLTRANHVFHIDRWWNPAVENQATDRAYRIGQVNRVIVHKFITTGSVEEKINRMILEKTRLSEDIVGSGEDWLGKLGVDQLRNLVALEQN